MRSKYILGLMILSMLTLTVMSVAAEEKIEADYGDIVKVDHFIYNEFEDYLLEVKYDVYIEIRKEVAGWHHGIVGLEVGENNTFKGIEYGGCVHIVFVRAILKHIPDDTETPYFISPDVDTFLVGAGAFAIENWFSLLIAGLLASYLGYKVIAK